MTSKVISLSLFKQTPSKCRETPNIFQLAGKIQDVCYEIGFWLHKERGLDVVRSPRGLNVCLVCVGALTREGSSLCLSLSEPAGAAASLTARGHSVSRTALPGVNTPRLNQWGQVLQTAGLPLRTCCSQSVRGFYQRFGWDSCVFGCRHVWTNQS